jgi:hypothetical protein
MGRRVGNRLAVLALVTIALARCFLCLHPAMLGDGRHDGAAIEESAGRGNSHAGRFRPVSSALMLSSIVAILLAVYLAFHLTRPAPTPPAGGTVRLLVPGNPFQPGDQFQLHLVLASPGSDVVQYQIVTDCNTPARQVVLMLSGPARFLDPRIASGSGQIAAERTVMVGFPWFPSLQSVQAYDIPIHAMRCPPGVLPSQSGTVTYMSQYVRHSFEESSGASHALQLPLVGDDTNADTDIPALGGAWASPFGLSVSVNADALPLADQIGIARPALIGSGDLTWTSQSFVRPSATWIDTDAATRDQFLILLLGAAIGIAGSLVASIAIDWARRPCPE